MKKIKEKKKLMRRRKKGGQVIKNDWKNYE